jgi:O-6-methylguanine DNA methyltransferase
VNRIKKNLNLIKGLIYHKNIIKNLNNYLNGRELLLKFPIVFLEGTSFQISVWKQLQKIPYGIKSNYSEIAQKIQRASAVRAVGSAIGKNPIMIYVPCHRVIKKSGNLGDYAWGRVKKKKLLHIESI